MTTTIPAGWKIQRGTDDDGEYIDITPPEGEAYWLRYYDEGIYMSERLTYRLASALLSATPAAPQPPAEPANAELLRALVDLEAEFRRVFPIYYYGEPWAHDKNVPLKVAQEVISHAKAQPVREPLTDAEIDQILDNEYSPDIGPSDWCRNVARAIERAHGIGEDK